jgi:hypothetical protein
MVPFWLVPILAKLAQRAVGEISKSVSSTATEIGKNRADAAERKRDACLKMQFCMKCGVEKTSGNFCTRCGNNTFFSGADIEREDLQEQEKERLLSEQKKRDRELKQVIKKARQRCLEIASWKYCLHCNASHFADVLFCPECGLDTVEIPRAFTYQYASAEFPDLVVSESAFDALLSGDLKLIHH